MITPPTLPPPQAAAWAVAILAKRQTAMWQAAARLKRPQSATHRAWVGCWLVWLFWAAWERLRWHYAMIPRTRRFGQIHICGTIYGVVQARLSACLCAVFGQR